MSNTEAPLDIKRFDLVVPSVVTKPHHGFVFPNGAKALVVEDSACQLAAAAVTVRVGSNQDPVNVPGLAHFCEHMLFMGTKKYPNEDEFDSFIRRNGGSTNAWTEAQGTTYYFTVSDGVFLDALDRFLEFFVDPTFNPSAVSRELEAVHSEDEKNHSVEYWRTDEILRSLADPRHPYHRYGNGNLTTLRDIPSSLGIDVRDELLSFYEKYYVADAVSVVLYSRRPAEEALPILDQQLKRMRQRNEIPPRMNSFVPTKEGTARVAPFAPTTMGRWFNIKTLTQERSVRVCFPFPDPVAQRHKLVAGYASHILGHECDVSLLGALKKRGWATEIVGGTSNARDDDDNVFYVDISLTVAGFKQVIDVIELMFKAIDLLTRGHFVEDAPKGEGYDSIQTDVFEQLLAEERLMFEMKELGRSESHCSSLSSALNTAHRLEHAWLEGYVPTEVDRAGSADVMRYLVPDNCVVFLSWNGFPGTGAGQSADSTVPQQPKNSGDNEEDEEEQEEEEEDEAPEAGSGAEELFASLPECARFPVTNETQFHKALHGSQPIPNDVLQTWKSARVSREDGLAFPPTNRFLATDFTIFSDASDATLTTQEIEDVPVVLESEYGDFYFMAHSNAVLKVPKATVTVEFFSLVPYADAKSRFYTRVMLLILGHQLKELSYMGELATIRNSVTASHGGVQLGMEGPMHHMSQFLREMTVAALKTSNLVGTQELFDTYRETYLRTLRSVRTQQPYEICSDRLMRLLIQSHYSFDDILTSVSNGNTPSAEAYAEYKDFVAKYLAALRFHMTLAGNVASVAEAKASYLDVVEEVVAARLVENARALSSEETSTVGFRTSVFLPVLTATGASSSTHVEGSTPILVAEECALNASDTNSAVVWEIQLGPETPELRVVADCLSSLLESRFFNALRTQETMGYIVASRCTRTHGLCVMKLIVQSAKPGADGWYILSRMIAFLDSAAASWDSIVCTDPQLDQVIKGTLRARQEPLKNISAFVGHVNANIHHPSGILRRPLEIAAIQSGKVISASTVKELFFSAVANSSPTRRSIAYMVHAPAFTEACLARAAAFSARRLPEVSPNRQFSITPEQRSSSFTTTLEWQLPAKVMELAPGSQDDAVKVVTADNKDTLLPPSYDDSEAAPCFTVVYLNTSSTSVTGAVLAEAIGGEWIATP
ncbi:peptidase, putative [Bodo saltans]|uniref:Peptidase, putative n=1 Tax=Bodo saltans TaxID=75058 RepID=A0A0S4JGH1_BODSA|nr:peptidase, putative [Bodo saltans]|eukprot:CUG89240.1 peptidase, putative [Bodo saltans]